MNNVTNKTEDRKNTMLNPLSQNMCMKKAHTRKAFAVAISIAIPNANCASSMLDVTNVKTVRKTNARNTPIKSGIGAGWLNAGWSSL